MSSFQPVAFEKRAFSISSKIGQDHRSSFPRRNQRPSRSHARSERDKAQHSHDGKAHTFGFRTGLRIFILIGGRARHPPALTESPI
jgi:hypothetical protein